MASQRRLGTQNPLMMRPLSSIIRFLIDFGGPNEAKIDQKSSSDDVKSDKSENVDF